MNTMNDTATKLVAKINDAKIDGKYKGTISAKVWAPKGAAWARIYLTETTKAMGQTKHGYVYVSAEGDVDYVSGDRWPQSTEKRIVKIISL